mmetsp:Transcript_21949/g.37545  ORF Transcript_21949/g.37545 Transcript_21949/m.37545 type:complete len:331 (+) Transcript_21949:94-1086(+)
MPPRVLIICGHPASGKSTVAQQLKAEFTAQGLSVQVVDEESLHLQRDAAYADVVSEKNTRGLLRCTLEKTLAAHPHGVTILDSLNNIKGYRYEIWCLARTAGARYCMVHVDTDVATCQTWNSSRSEDQRYSAAVFDDLTSRFERPDSKQRWDAPLFTLKPAGDAEEAQVAFQAVLSCMGDAQGMSAGSTHGVTPGGTAKGLKPSNTTSNQMLQGTNVLHDLDAAVQLVIDSVADAQAAAAGGPAGLVRVPASTGPGPPTGRQSGPSLQLDQFVPLAELRRHKRSFLKLATKITFSRLSDPAAAQRMFVDYIIAEVAGARQPDPSYNSHDY